MGPGTIRKGRGAGGLGGTYPAEGIRSTDADGVQQRLGALRKMSKNRAQCSRALEGEVGQGGLEAVVEELAD